MAALESLYVAAFEGRLEDAKQILATSPTAVTAAAPEAQRDLLRLAILSRHLATVQWVLALGIPLRTENVEWLYTHAIKLGEGAIAEAIRQAASDGLPIRVRHLELAVRHGHLAILQQMLTIRPPSEQDMFHILVAALHNRRPEIVAYVQGRKPEPIFDADMAPPPEVVLEHRDTILRSVKTNGMGPAWMIKQLDSMYADLQFPELIVALMNEIRTPTTLSVRVTLTQLSTDRGWWAMGHYRPRVAAQLPAYQPRNEYRRAMEAALLHLLGQNLSQYVLRAT